MAALLAALMVAGALAVGGSPPAGAWTRPPDRIAGADRWETAVRISQVLHPSGAPAAVVVSGEAFPDGLVGGPFAALVGGPVLLTGRNGLPDVTRDELRRLGARDIFVLGGTAAVREVVVAQIRLATGVTPRRIAGEDRYETAAAVAARFPTGPHTVLVADGTDFPDALTGGAASARAGAPLLLTHPEVLPAATRAQLERLAPAEVAVLGGPRAVSEAVVAEVAATVPAVRRLAGADRFATAAVIAADRAPGATQAVVATGYAFPDALAAAPLAARLDGPVLLTATTCVPQDAVVRLRDLHWPDITVVGGPNAVSPAALAVVPCTPVADGEIAPGLHLTTHLRPGPVVARVLTVDRTRGLDVRVVPATGQLSGRHLTTYTARRWGALAAVNGDFFHADGRPAHAMASFGRLLKAPGAPNSVVAVDEARRDSHYQGPPAPTVLIAGGATQLRVNRINEGAPGGSEIALFTTEAPGSAFRSDGRSMCTVAIRPTGPPALAADGATQQPYSVVSARTCGATSVHVGPHDVLVAPASSPGAAQLGNLPAGGSLTKIWRLASWDNVFDAVGANARLVDRGAISTDVAHNNGPFWNERAPRTAAGWFADGRMVLVTVDGRRSGYSIGMTPRELADFLLSIGVFAAANLDGGGSTTMAVRGVLANRPSDAAGERPVGNVVLVVPTPPMAAASTGGLPAGGPPPVAGIPGVDPMTDPASLGGWLASR